MELSFAPIRVQWYGDDLNVPSHQLFERHRKIFIFDPHRFLEIYITVVPIHRKAYAFARTPISHNWGLLLKTKTYILVIFISRYKNAIKILPF